MLAKLGYHATTVVANGRDVLHALEYQHYDVILLDVQMPEMDGIETTRGITMRWQPHERPYIIALTAHAMQGYKEWLMHIGMDDYVSKPVDIKQLAAALERSIQYRPPTPTSHIPPHNNT